MRDERRRGGSLQESEIENEKERIIGIAAAAHSPTGFSFRVYASDNHALDIEICTNLVEGAWTKLQTKQPRYGAFDYTDLQSATRPSCFYRVSR